MKSLYGDRANTFRMLFNFKAEVEKRSPSFLCVLSLALMDSKWDAVHI
jgi:hypothetical protein